jgi:diaminohydroxyphosphoribosylaminopyrimidine deaminase/5-amino-6-(5-phosphoribosylamino)uracil reductase
MSGGHSEPVLEHERYMARALELAERGRGSVSPNPMVGCVIVKDDEVVGEGYHQRAGEAHAEVLALERAGERAHGATVYVTLEPCNHHGRTPPCTEALIATRVRRVVVASLDPNPVAAGGIERLRAAGIEVVSGVLRDEAERLNEVFYTFHRLERPFVLYKAAMTLDGKIATRSGQSRWITSKPARERVQRWRNELDAIAVGVNTVLLDDPLLTCRLSQGRSPRKVVFDSAARTPANAKLFEADPQGRAAEVIVFVTQQAPAARVEALEARGAKVVVVGSAKGRVDVGEALAALKARGVTSLLLEGGGTLAWAFFEARAVDQVAIFIAPKLVGGAGASPLGGLGARTMDEALPLEGVRIEHVGSDLLVNGRVRYPANEGAEVALHAAAESKQPPASMHPHEEGR